jgi:hypothetical protein
MSNVVIVELEDGSVSESKCLGEDVILLVLDWDELDQDDASDLLIKRDEVRELNLPPEVSVPIITRLEELIDERDEEEEDEEGDDDDALEEDMEDDGEDEELADARNNHGQGDDDDVVDEA